MESAEAESATVTVGRIARLRRELVPRYALAAVIVCAAGGWYLLKELAPLLRPLVLAVFLIYTVLPVHQLLRRRVSSTAALVLLAIIVAVALVGLALMVYGNLVDLNADLPRLIERTQRLIDGVRDWGRRNLTAWVLDTGPH